MRVLLFLIFPLLEFYLLIRMGAVMGALNVVLWCIATAVLGGWVMKRQSLAVMNRMREEMAAGQMPQESALEGALVFAAGLLLVLPGFITDAAGLLLLIPFVRHLAALRLSGYLSSHQDFGSRGFSSRVIFFSSGGAPSRGGQEQHPRQARIIDSTPRTEGRNDPDSLIIDCEPGDADRKGGEGAEPRQDGPGDRS